MITLRYGQSRFRTTRIHALCFCASGLGANRRPAAALCGCACLFDHDAVAGEEVSGGSEWVSFTRPVRRAAGSEWVTELHWRMCGPQTRPLADADLQNFLDPQTESWSLVDLPPLTPFPSLPQPLMVARQEVGWGVQSSVTPARRRFYYDWS